MTTDLTLGWGFLVFLLIRFVNRAIAAVQKAEEAAPAADPADVVLLREIRDELKKRPGA